MEVGGQLHVAAPLPSIPIEYGVDGPQSRSGRGGEEKISHHWHRRELNPSRLARSVVCTLTELFQLT
jgi:hypothetical protein